MPSSRSLAPRLALGLIVGIWVALSGAVAIGTPAWEANDEPDHVRNVQQLVDGRWYRLIEGAGFEAHQPPAYYAVLAGWQKLLGIPGRDLIAPPLRPPSDGVMGGIMLHDVPTDGYDQRLVGALRIPGVALGVLSLLLTAFAARRLSDDPWTPPVAAAWVAAVPKFTFLAGVVNNDNLGVLVGAAGVAVLAIGFGRFPPPPGSWLRVAAALGVVAGLGILTKLTVAWLAPALLVGALLGAARAQRLRALIAFAAAAVVVCGWWLVQNQVRYGDPLAAAATHDHLAALFPPIFDTGPFAHQAFTEAPKWLWKTFWYVSGYNQFDWNWYVYLPLWLGLLVALAGLALRGRPLAPQPAALPLLGLIIAGAVFAFWITAVETTTAQARVVFFVLPALALLAALGLERWRAQWWLRLAVPALGMIFTAIALRRDVFDVYVL